MTVAADSGWGGFFHDDEFDGPAVAARIVAGQGGCFRLWFQFRQPPIASGRALSRIARELRVLSAAGERRAECGEEAE